MPCLTPISPVVNTCGLVLSRIAPLLYFGAAAPEDEVVAAGFGAMVIASELAEFDAGQYSALKVMHVELKDTGEPLDEAAGAEALGAALFAVRQAAGNVPTLICSPSGRNRAALVAALALRLTSAAGAKQAVRAVRDASPNALDNPFLEAAVYGAQ
jgi:hypothetical protein